MSYFEVCARCGKGWSHADRYCTVHEGVEVAHAMPADYCPHCNPTWPTPDTWTWANILRVNPSQGILQDAEFVRHCIDSLHAHGVLKIYVQDRLYPRSE